MSEDLTKSIGEAKVLFKASESGWAHPLTVSEGKQIYVTDGPWLVKEETGLIMFWSSFHNGSYAVGIAISESGKLTGPWRHCEDLFFEQDGGHGMMFEGFDGQKYFAVHQPNVGPYERAQFLKIKKTRQAYCLM